MKYVDFCYEDWKSRYGFPPPWLAKDYVFLTKCEKALEERAEPAWKYYLACNEEYVEGHPPSKFMADLSRWAVGGEGLKVLKVGNRSLPIKGWVELEDGRLKLQQNGTSFFLDPRSNPERFYCSNHGELGEFASLEPGTVKKLKRYQFKQRNARWISKS